MIGLAYRQWGELTIPELRALGSILVVSRFATGAVLGPPVLRGTSGSPIVLTLWVGCMNLLWFVAGAPINRRFRDQFD